MEPVPIAAPLTFSSVSFTVLLSLISRLSITVNSTNAGASGLPAYLRQSDWVKWIIFSISASSDTLISALISKVTGQVLASPSTVKGILTRPADSLYEYASLAKPITASPAPSSVLLSQEASIRAETAANAIYFNVFIFFYTLTFVCFILFILHLWIGLNLILRNRPQEVWIVGLPGADCIVLALLEQ